jgi:hypothetical protein
VFAGLDLDGAVAPCSADEPADRPAGGLLDEAGDREGGEDDREVSLDRGAFVVVDRPRGKIALRHPE